MSDQADIPAHVRAYIKSLEEENSKMKPIYDAAVGTARAAVALDDGMLAYSPCNFREPYTDVYRKKYQQYPMVNFFQSISSRAAAGVGC